MPCSVRTAYSPRRSDSQFSRRTRPAFSMRVIWWESRLLDWRVAAARSLIRIRVVLGLGEVHQDLVVVIVRPNGCRSFSSWYISSLLTSRWVRQAHCSASVSQRVAVSVSM